MLRRIALTFPWLLFGAVTAPFAHAESSAVWTASAISQHITVDGHLDEPAWDLAAPLPDLIQQDPHPGEPTPYRTETRILVDDKALYIWILCHDPDPAGIAVHTMQRDGSVRGDDTITLVLDILFCP